MVGKELHSEIHDTLDRLGAPRMTMSIPPRDATLSERIRGLHRELTDAAAKSLAAARAGFDTAMAAVVRERDEVIRQRGEAVRNVTATLAVLDDERWRANQQHGRAEAAEKREAEALVEIDALDRALSAAGLPTAETLAGRVAGLQMMRAEALSEARALTTERDNCREVLRKEREERAAEKAAMGEALAGLRAEKTRLEGEVDRLRSLIAGFAAASRALERIIVAGLRQ